VIRVDKNYYMMLKNGIIKHFKTAAMSKAQQKKKAVQEIPEHDNNSTSKIILTFIIVCFVTILALILGSYAILKKNSSNTTQSSKPLTLSSQYIKIQDDKQYVDITAKNGFTPDVVTIRSGVKTVLKVKTENTYDCSSVINIASLGISKNLPTSGTTEVDIPAQQSGSTLNATCSIGQYHLIINFIDTNKA